MFSSRLQRSFHQKINFKIHPKLKGFWELARADKPIGTWLLYLPCTWSIMWAPPTMESLKMMALFGTGAWIMRGAGCTINDLWDRKIDQQVERTKSRPIAKGLITVPEAIGFLGLHLLSGLAILTQLNTPSILMGLGVMPLVVAYPLCKRITFWPQAVLGLTFNWGVWVGATAMSVPWVPAAWLYLAGVSWTLVYDTIYALQDIRDDRLVGVKSTAIRFGDQWRSWLSFFSASSVGCLAMAGYMGGLGPAYYLVSVLGAAAHYSWQLSTLDPLKARDCWNKFTSNRWLGLLVGAGIFLDHFF